MRHPRESFAHKSVHAIKARVDYLPQTIIDGFYKFLYHNGMLALTSHRPYWHAFKTACRRFRRTRKSATFKHLLQAGLNRMRKVPVVAWPSTPIHRAPSPLVDSHG